MSDTITITTEMILLAIIILMIGFMSRNTMQNHAELIEIMQDPLYTHCRVRTHLRGETDR